jgi:hypothetical protein
MFRHAMLSIAMMAALAVLPATLPGQQWPGSSDALADPDNTSCFDTFSSSASGENFRICLSRHGNLMRLESPLGFEHIRVGTFLEGYSLCQQNVLSGYDVGFVEVGFDNGTVSQPGGAGTLPLIVTRDTNDGLFRLIQTINWNPAEKEVTIEMQVKNVSGVQQVDVSLIRIVDFDVDGDVFNHWAKAFNTVFAWRDAFDWGSASHQLNLAAATPKFFHFPDVTGFDIDCIPSSAEQTPTFGDFVGRMTYFLGTINDNKSKRVTYIYRVL